MAWQNGAERAPNNNLALPPIEMIRLYGLRSKIELSFKQALRVLGAYAYHFWMRGMPKISRGSGTQHSRTISGPATRRIGDEIVNLKTNNMIW